MGAPSHVKAGDVLGGKYRVERVLGTGGMGMVVAARHVQLGQRVALKFMLKDALRDPGNAERFAREARAAVRLQSPHTARVSDVGKLKNGEPYMVMEYLDGLDLDEVLSRHGPMAPHVAVDYILQACEAFAEAHGLGMIHRDIKLKNLFLSQTVAGAPIVKVLDFGLAKTIGAIGDVSLTATAAVFGSPQYMSPEQMRSAKDVDARSDIWSIGVCLYELLTSRVPFDAAGVAEICAMVLKDPVTPPSAWAPGLPPDLEAVVLKCLEKDPALRYQTVAELAFALEPWAAVAGSARRILHVMESVKESVKQTGDRTLMNADTAMENDGPKTMDAWDSGEQMRPSRRIPRYAGWIAASAFFGLSGIALVWMSLSGASGHTAASADEPLTSAPQVVPDPPSAAPIPAPIAASAEPVSAAAAPSAPDPSPAATASSTAIPPPVMRPIAPAVITNPPVKPPRPAVTGPRPPTAPKPPGAPAPAKSAAIENRF